MSKLESGAEIHQRVFGIGMNKTGTTSLKRCFGALDLYPIAPNALESVEMKEAVRGLFEQGDYEPILKMAADYRSFEDRPWNVWEMYQRLDQRFPDSRFILTIREPESWWRSTGRWITVVKPRMAKKYLRHLGAASLAKADMIAAYEQYNEGVIEYFAGTDKLLVIDFEKEKMTLISVKDIKWYSHAESIIEEWAEQFVRVANKQPGEIVKDSAGFTLKPW